MPVIGSPLLLLTAREERRAGNQFSQERRAGNRHSTEGTCTLIIRALMISVAPSVPPFSATSMPHLTVPTSAHQCHISV
ncbi:unnamed protein product, partial [Staurois parvus]